MLAFTLADRQDNAKRLSEFASEFCSGALVANDDAWRIP